jgi:hypothetical protein
MRVDLRYASSPTFKSPGLSGIQLRQCLNEAIAPYPICERAGSRLAQPLLPRGGWRTVAMFHKKASFCQDCVLLHTAFQSRRIYFVYCLGVYERRATPVSITHPSFRLQQPW